MSRSPAILFGVLMSVADTKNELREALLAARIARVSPLPPEACRWILSETPLAVDDRLRLLTDLIDRIAAANPRPYPYLTVSALAASLPVFTLADRANDSVNLRNALHHVSGLLAISHLKVLIDEDWEVVSELARFEACHPHHFASDYLTVDFFRWMCELAECGMPPQSPGAKRSSSLDRQRPGLAQWSECFRQAEELLTAEVDSHELKAMFSGQQSNQYAAFMNLLERTRSSFHAENQFRVRTEEPRIDTPLGKESIEIKEPVNSRLAENLKTPTAKKLDKASSLQLMLASHSAIEGCFLSLDNDGLYEAIDELLVEARNEVVPLNVVVIRDLNENAESSVSQAVRPWFVTICDALADSMSDRVFSKILGVVSGELIYLQGGGDRLKIMPWIRAAMESCTAQLPDESVQGDEDTERSSNGLIAGIASVGRPGKSFRSQVLLQASLRCIEAASRQGAGSIKSIEVF